MLWLISTVTYLAYMMLMTLEPDILKQFLDTGEMEGMKVTPELILLFAILVLVPLIMAFLSLTLKNPINRWANIIVGAVLAVLWCVDVSEAVAKPSAWATLITLSTVVALALIVWYAWKSKKEA